MANDVTSEDKKRARVGWKRAKHGNFYKFDSSLEDWTSYTERLQLHSMANDVWSEDTKRAILLIKCGVQTYQLIKNLLAPTSPTDKSFKDVVQLTTDHLQP